VVVVINVTIGLVQEGKAERAAEALKAMLSATATVLRNGQKVSVPADEVVPGDVIFILSGDRVPADLRLVGSTNLQVQEAILTGESLPVSKAALPPGGVREDAPLGDRLNMCFSGTMAVYGAGTGVAVATGDAAELGRINALVSSVDAKSTPLLDQLEVFGRWIALITVLLAVVTFLISFLARGNVASAAFSEAVSVAVAIIPEGLPAVTTITLALGVRHMAAQNAIIRQLPAVETLGSVSVICTDKTGTLTKNEVSRAWARRRGAQRRRPSCL
jgi:magnesium-transporting ATPase (P-type)